MKHAFKIPAGAFFIVLLLAFSGTAFAELTRAECSKVLETKTVEGIYQGTDCGDSCYVFLKLDNGEDFGAYADPEEVEKLFGQTPGKRVSVTYTMERYWQYESVEETNPDGPGYCSEGEFFQSGKLLGDK